jgi:serine-type D-Ala-D-Ala carboxypeptidase (penicillin-binding protein 5/6)
VTRGHRALAVAAALAACGVTPPAARAAAPSTHARAATVVEASTGRVAMRKNASGSRAIASATKLMTVLIVLERSSLEDVVTAPSYHPLPAESVLGLRAGERMRVRDLLRAVLLASANDAAMALAVHVGGSRTAFVHRMNARAKALGLRHTHYANPIGLDDRANYSSAADLVALTRVLLRNSFFARTVAMARATLQSGARRRTVSNRNLLVGRQRLVVGVKTGHTIDAGYVLVGAGRRNGVTVVSAVLGEPSESLRDSDTLALLRYGVGRFRLAHPVRRGQVLARVRLRYRDDRVALVPRQAISHVVQRGDRLTVAVSGVPDTVDGPLKAGAPLGTVIVRANGRVVGRTSLVTQRAVAEATLAQRLGDYVTRPLTLVLLGALLVCSLQLTLLRRRAGRRGRRVMERGRDAEAA